ncbi:hypothetical protein ABE10_11015 [Bacillus toyonensis]|nr:hypothetical protein [Bacillus toyonensis]
MSYKAEHITPTVDAWARFREAVSTGAGDSLAAWVDYRRKLAAAERAEESAKMSAYLTASAAHKKRQDEIAEANSELRRFRDARARAAAQKRPSEHLHADEIAAVNQTLNNLGAGHERSLDDVSWVNWTHYTEKPSSWFGSVGFNTIPHHINLIETVEQIIRGNL